MHRRCSTTKPGAAAGSSGRYDWGETALCRGRLVLRRHFIRFTGAGRIGPVPAGNDLLREDIASAARLGFLLDGEIKSLSQAATVFCLMNRDIHTTVPGVKNQAEAEEIARTIDLEHFSPAQMTRLRELYHNGFRN